MPPITTIARQMFDICLLRSAPQHLPYSWELLALTLIVSVGLAYPAMQVLAPTPSPLAKLLFGLLFTLGLTYGILAIRGLKVRFVQTASALFGTDAIITMAAFPVIYAADAAGAQDTFTRLALIGLGIWNLLVMGHIFRHAMSLPLPGGILVALGYVFGSLFVSQLIQG